MERRHRDCHCHKRLFYLLHAFLRLIHMCTQTLTLFTQGSILLASNTPAFRHHLEVLTLRLLSIRRAASDLLLLLAFVTAELFTSLTAGIDTGHTLFIISFGLFAWTKNI